MLNKHNLFSSDNGFLSLENSESSFSTNNDIRKQRIHNVLKTIIGHLDINSMRNKFVSVDNIIKAFDISLIPESMLDYTFLFNEFYVAGFRQDWNRFGGSLMLFINGNFPCRSLNNILNFEISNR